MCYSESFFSERNDNAKSGRDGHQDCVDESTIFSKMITELRGEDSIGFELVKSVIFTI